MPRAPRRHQVRIARVFFVAALTLTGLLLPLVGAPPADATARSVFVGHRTPLRVDLHSLEPSALRPGQPVDVSGVVTNRDRQTWQNLKVYLVTSAGPMTTQRQLAAALETDPDAEIGTRVVEPGTFAELGDLPAGQSQRFSLRVPFRRLGISGAPGVYWIGVHVLATSPEGIRDAVADARMRTFIPLLPDKPRPPVPVRLALIWPLTAPVPELRDGVFANDTLGASMDTDGRLSALLGMAATAPAGLSLLVDPAVLSAAQEMTQGYAVEARYKREGPSAAAARDWLADFVAQAQDGPAVLSLPYGDPDVTSLVHAKLGNVLSPAVAAGQAVLRRLEVEATTAAWPAHGLADRPALAAAGRAGAALSVLSDEALPPSPTTRPDSTLKIRAGNHLVPVVVTDSATLAGGPRPGPTDSALQVRQRILAETALASLGATPGQPTTLVATPPRYWDPGDQWAAARFFEGLDVPWLSIRPVTAVLARTAPDFVGLLRYPDRAAAAELPSPVLDGVRALRHVSATLTGLLTDSSQERPQLDQALGLAASVAWRGDARTGSSITDRHVDQIRRSLESVSVQASQFVTLSSRSGRFPVTIVNNLDEQITVGLSVVSANRALKVDPVRPVTIQANQRTTLTVTARAETVGLTNVSIQAETRDGRRFGKPQVVDVRATQYGVVGWVLIGAGITVLAATSALRIGRRLLGRQRLAAPTTAR